MTPRAALTSLNFLSMMNEEANRVSAIFSNERCVYSLYMVRAFVWFCTKLWIWSASSIILPIHVTSEEMDLSAKFKEWTMQGVQKTCKSKKDKYKWLYNTNKLTTQIINNEMCHKWKYLWIFSFHNHVNSVANRCIVRDDLYTRINTYFFNGFDE